MKKINWKKMRSMIPNKIRIAPRVFYEVLWVHGFHSDKTGDKTYGETRFDSKQIVLNSDQADKESVHTYVHEMYHALSEQYDIGLTEK